MIETKAPGKLFIAGEYAVVEPAQPAVLVAVDRFITVRIAERYPESSQEPGSAHVNAVFMIVNRLLSERGVTPRAFSLEVLSELENEEGVKFGLGSSAAVTVALVSALNQAYELNLNAVERFKLAMLATISVTPLASGGDLAASTFGGWIRYCAPDRARLASHLSLHGILETLASDCWQGLEIRVLPTPRNARLVVGWTGTPASTESLVDLARDAAPSDDELSARRYSNFLQNSSDCVERLTTAVETDSSEIFDALRDARGVLQQLSADRNLNVETPSLAALCITAEKLGFAAKSSGAGGGDCGIVLVTPGVEVTRLHAEWQQQQILPLDLQVLAPIDDAEGGIYVD